MFTSIINTSITLSSFLICSLSALLLGLLVAFTHMKTNNGTRNFTIALSVLPLLISIVIIMVNGNLGTGVAVAGAFSLVRFRSVPGTAREIVSIFFAMTIGLAIGIGYIGYAVLATVIGCLFLIILSKISFGKKENIILKIVVPEDLNYEKEFKSIFDKYLTSYSLLKIKTVNLGSLYELTYKVDIRKDEKEFLDEIRTHNSNLKVVLAKDEYNEEDL